MKKNNVIQNILDIIKDSAVFLLLFIGINILLSSVLFLVNVSISELNIILSAILTAISVILLYKKKEKNKVIISAGIAIIILIFALFVASFTYDRTWDGNTYHKLAVGILKDGWNPVYQTAEEYIALDPSNLGIEDDGRNSIWVEHYPKASWIFAANVYSVTGSIETAKIINMLMMYIAFGIIINYMYKKVNFIFAFLIAFFIAINPVTIVQVFNYYIDGLMGLCIYIILCMLLALSDRSIKDKNERREYLLILAIAIIICINLKFTGLVYAGMFCIMFFVYWLIRAFKEGNFKEAFIKYMIYYVTVVLIAVCIVGFSSYVQNLFVKGHPLYPLMGKDKVDIMTYNEPKSFITRGPIDKFFTSMFAVSENIQSNNTDRDPVLKVPFTFSIKELKQFARPDTRMAGFGIWFSGIFVFTIIGIGYVIFTLLKKKSYEEFGLLLAFLLVCTLLVLITDGSWWARYVPYIYLLPILLVYLLAKTETKVNKIIAFIMSALLFANIGAVSISQFAYQYITRNDIAKKIIEMKSIEEQNGKVVVALNSDAFSAMLYNLRDEDINIELKKLEELKSKKHVNYFYYEIETDDKLNK